MPTISVIMPVYNTEKYLQQSIESILNQTYKDFEFIIINDGSSDNSLSILEEYAETDSRIKIISRENKGLVYSLNEGISVANGKYIARMDADDISLPNRFMEQIKYMENTNIDICGTYVEAIGDDENLIKMKENEYNISLDLYSLMNGHALCHPSVLLKKNAIKCIGGYDINYKYCEDLELWLRFIKKGYKIKVIPIKLLKYRTRLDSKSMIERENALVDFINMRLDFVKEKLYSDTFDYIIWGAGNGGALAYKIIRERHKESKFNGFIDMYKTGNSIYTPKEVKSLKFDYIFVATTPGKLDAFKFLNNLNYKYITHYINLYS